MSTSADTPANPPDLKQPNAPDPARTYLLGEDILDRAKQLSQEIAGRVRQVAGAPGDPTQDRGPHHPPA